MDRYYEVVPVIYRRDRLAPHPATAIAIGVHLDYLFMKLINKLRRYLRSITRCKTECEDLQELLASIHPDVGTTAHALENCKRLRIETTPQESWLRRLETELRETEKLIDKCAPSGVFTNIPGDGLPKKFSAQMETLKRFADELPQMHGVLKNLQMTREVQEVVGIRHAEFVPDRIRYETRPYSFHRVPSFGNYTNHDAEFVSDRIGYELRPCSFRRMPSFGNYRYHDAEFVCVDGMYFPEARCDYFGAQPIVFPSHASCGSWVPAMNPYYVKHIGSEYY